MREFDRNELGGGALVVGYAVVLAALYRTPTTALAAATADLQSILYFVVLPVAGVLTGVYAYLDGPFSAIPLFLLGTYLGFLGLALTVGALLSSAPVGVPLGAGLVGLTLAVLTLVTRLLRFADLLGLGSLGLASS